MNAQIALSLVALLALGACQSSPERLPNAPRYIVQFDSNPRGAVVLEGDRILCRETPCSRTLKKGAHRISMHSEEHGPRTEEIFVDRDAEIIWTLSARFSELHVLSRIEGIRVEIDHRPLGVAPLTRARIPSGRHTLRFRHPCYQDQTLDIDVPPGTTHTVETHPRPRRAWLEVEAIAPDGEEVRAPLKIGETVLGSAPGLFEVPLCARTLQIDTNEHGSYSGGLLLQEGEVTQITAFLGREISEKDKIKGFVVMPRGTFTMGSPSDAPHRESDEFQHKVTISRPFLLQATELTQREWSTLIPHNPSANACRDCPVENITWWEAAHYLNLRSLQEGLPPCYRLQGCRREAGQGMTCESAQSHGSRCRGYRLPTEAEWEYAAQPPGDPQKKIRGWTGNLSSTTQRAGTLGDNGRGLFDMVGNVEEWMHDFSAPYPAGQVRDPQGPAVGSRKVVRGGSWKSPKRRARVAYRDSATPSTRNAERGFRMARTLH